MIKYISGDVAACSPDDMDAQCHCRELNYNNFSEDVIVCSSNDFSVHCRHSVCLSVCKIQTVLISRPHVMATGTGAVTFRGRVLDLTSWVWSEARGRGHSWRHTTNAEC